jgi:glycerol uptake facilitator-like aquaporin
MGISAPTSSSDSSRSTIGGAFRSAHCSRTCSTRRGVTAAYWFTASTSFANPAVVIARSLTNTFSGIRPVDAPAFIAVQFAGAVCGLGLMGWLLSQSGNADEAISPEAQL